MRLTNKMKEIMLWNAKHLNDDVYGMTTAEMERNADMYMKAEVSLDSEIEEQTRMLEEYPDYCTPSNRVKVWLSENENDWKYLEIERAFAQKHSDSWSMRCPEFRFSRFSEHVKKNIIIYTDRRKADNEMWNKVNDALSRCTTAKQLIAKCPETAAFFDEDGEFCIPGWGK